MNNLKAEDLKLKLNANGFSNVSIEYMPNMITKQIVIFIDHLKRYQLVELISFSIGFEMFIQSDSDSPNHILVTIF